VPAAHLQQLVQAADERAWLELVRLLGGQLPQRLELLRTRTQAAAPPHVNPVLRQHALRSWQALHESVTRFTQQIAGERAGNAAWQLQAAQAVSALKHSVDDAIEGGASDMRALTEQAGWCVGNFELPSCPRDQRN
jgi:hypothetical protein